MSSRDTSRPVPPLRAARVCFDIALDGMLWHRRSLLMGLLLGFPLLLALVFRGVLASGGRSDLSGFDAYGYVAAFYYLRNVVPLVALFYASSLIADEVEGRTIVYLLSRPVQRVAILVGKFAAFLATTLALTLPPVVATFLLLSSAGGGGLVPHVPDLLRDLAVLTLALTAYGALFTLLGVLLTRPALPGLLFLFLWELVANLPGWLPRLTITGYLRSLMSHRPPSEDAVFEMFAGTIPAAESVIVLVVLSSMLLAAAAAIFSRREYVVEQ